MFVYVQRCMYTFFFDQMLVRIYTKNLLWKSIGPSKLNKACTKYHQAETEQKSSAVGKEKNTAHSSIDILY